MPKSFVVVTTINSPTRAMRTLAHGCRNADFQFIVIGDRKGPDTFDLPPAQFLNIRAQAQLRFQLARECPEGHYARKNIGYLLAISQQATCIIETDDDNIPRPEFFRDRTRDVLARPSTKNGWVNVYRHFSESAAWPRGMPLTEVLSAQQDLSSSPLQLVTSPIHQGLADENPDVDAIYRLVHPLPITFLIREPVALAAGSLCPFNSQNTTWFPEAYPLLYLPAYCSFRMTDIWRSFVAQRIAWENKWPIVFHAATVWQERNDHCLMRDFEQEVPGYLLNDQIASTLRSLTLRPGTEYLADNLNVCYEALISLGAVGREEIKLLAAWTRDLASIESKESNDKREAG